MRGASFASPIVAGLLAREGGGWTLVKLEVLAEAKTLYPDMIETLRAGAVTDVPT